MKYTILSFIILFSLAANVNAQTLQWNARYNGTANGDDVITSMVTDASGNVYVTGYVNNGLSGTDYVTIKYNTNGVKQWLATYNGPGSGDDVAYAICIDKSGNVYVTGLSDALTGADYRVVKYSQNNLIADDKNAQYNVANSLVLFQNTPNPFKTSTNISFKIENKISQLTAVKLWIEDANGNPLTILIDKKLNNGTYTIEWNSQSSLPGIYYCRLLCDEALQTKKMIMVR